METTLNDHNRLADDALVGFINSVRTGKGSKLTIINDATGNRITVRVRRPPRWQLVLVDLMTGSDNEKSYTFVGSINKDGVYKPSSKSKAKKADKDRARTFLDWTLAASKHGNLRTVRVLHEGRCAHCNRTLTTPESIARGLGPVCSGGH